MQKIFKILLFSILTVSLMFTTACNQKESSNVSYGDDRAQIEDLQARYLFALDFFDLDTYVSTFTEDGVLDIIDYKVKGRDAIRKAIQEAKAVFDHSDKPGTGRHNITNIVIKVDGDKAWSRSYWFHYSNINPEGKAVFDGYGHYEDELVKIDGKWLFSKRVIYNEGNEKWRAATENPAW